MAHFQQAVLRLLGAASYDYFNEPHRLFNGSRKIVGIDGSSPVLSITEAVGEDLQGQGAKPLPLRPWALFLYCLSSFSPWKAAFPFISFKWLFCFLYGNACSDI